MSLDFGSKITCETSYKFYSKAATSNAKKCYILNLRMMLYVLDYFICSNILLTIAVI